METPTPEELNKLLRDLSGPVIAVTRRYSAQILGQLPTSSAEVVQALSAAVALDSDPEVRTAAILALQSPIHQEFIKEHPDLMQQAIESAVRGKRQDQQEIELKITTEFQHILSREKRAYLLFFLSILAFFGGFILLLALGMDFKTMDVVLRVVQVGVLASAVFFAWRNWRKYRCPNCDGWLGGFKAGINVLWASPPLKCPYCGTRLM